MAILALPFLNTHSLKGAEDLLKQEGYVEYCNQAVDDEYVDGSMTWEPIKTEWARNV